MEKKRFFANHAKSSAAVISIAIHALLLVIAVSFVAVTVYKKPEQEFEAKPLNREKMQLKKLKVPVKARKKNAPKPKLTKRIMVDTRFNQSVPDIKIPDIMGVKGGVGGIGAGGLDGDGSLGFAMPEIKIFGVKSRGEKVFIILDSNPRMMYDELGGVPAYALIKQELVTILGNLSPTVLFNIAVYEQSKAVVLFPQMVPANNSNVSQVDEWLAPLNAVDTAKSRGKYGVNTLSPDVGTWIEREEGYAVPPLKRTRFWSTPMMVAMQQQADAVFVLAESWQWQMHKVGEDKTSEKVRAEYEAIQAKAKAMLDKENAERLRKGKIPLVLSGHAIARYYFPDVEKPDGQEQYHYSSKELAKAFAKQRKDSASKSKVPLQLAKKKSKIPFTMNVIHFIPQGEEGDGDNFGGNGGNFRELTGLLGGEYRTLAGMEAIQSSATQ